VFSVWIYDDMCVCVCKLNMNTTRDLLREDDASSDFVAHRRTEACP